MLSIMQPLAALERASAGYAERLAAAFDPGFDQPPFEAWQASSAVQIAAFGSPDALDRSVRHPAHDMSGRLFLGLRIGDLVLHGWDLARSTGGDESLDEDLVQLVWETYQPILEAAGKRGTFGNGASGQVPADAPLGLRLLDLSGRRP